MKTGKIAFKYILKTFIHNQTDLNLLRNMQVGDRTAVTQAAPSGVAGGWARGPVNDTHSPQTSRTQPALPGRDAFGLLLAKGRGKPVLPSRSQEPLESSPRS